KTPSKGLTETRESPDGGFRPGRVCGAQGRTARAVPAARTAGSLLGEGCDGHLPARYSSVRRRGGPPGRRGVRGAPRARAAPAAARLAGGAAVPLAVPRPRAPAAGGAGREAPRGAGQPARRRVAVHRGAGARGLPARERGPRVGPAFVRAVLPAPAGPGR